MRFLLLFSIICYQFFNMLLGQKQVLNYLAPDSMIRKYHILQITENGLGSARDTTPYWITKEYFDPAGRLTKRTKLNTHMWYNIDEFHYRPLFKKISRYTTHYDFNHRRKKGDTLIKIYKTTFNFPKATKTKTYTIDGKNSIQVFTYDSLGLLRKHYRNFKGRESYCNYAYNNHRQLISKKFYFIEHNKESKLHYMDTFEYNSIGLLFRETNFRDMANDSSKIHYNLEIFVTYFYNDKGLLIEKVNTNRYFFPDRTDLISTKFIYTYQFYP